MGEEPGKGPRKCGRNQEWQAGRAKSFRNCKWVALILQWAYGLTSNELVNMNSNHRLLQKNKPKLTGFSTVNKEGSEVLRA